VYDGKVTTKPEMEFLGSRVRRIGHNNRKWNTWGRVYEGKLRQNRKWNSSGRAFDTVVATTTGSKIFPTQSSRQQPEMEFFRDRGREPNVAEQLTQTRRTATSLMLFAVVAFIYVLLTASTLSLAAQRTGITVLVVVTRANSAS